MKYTDQKKAEENMEDDEASGKSKPRSCIQCVTRHKVRLPVYLTVIFFAMSTWIAIVGIFVEMPLLVDFLPESWNLPSHLIIIIQCANLGPAIYAVVNKMKSGTKKKETTVSWFQDSDLIVIFVILVFAILAMLLLSLVWMVTVEVGGSAHSIPLFSLACISALVSCTTSVVSLPYMARFKPGYISAYYIGQGLCGMIPGLLGLAQGLGQEPECIFHNSTILYNSTLSNVTFGMSDVKHRPPSFSVSIFFGIITLLLLVSALAFGLLNFSSFCRAEMVCSEKVCQVFGKTANLTHGDSVAISDSEKSISSPMPESPDVTEEKDSQKVLVKVSKSAQKAKSYSKQCGQSVLLLTIVGIVNGLTNSILPATQSFTCLPYGRITYTLSVRLSSIASPLASLSTLFLPNASLLLINVLMAIASFIAAFHLVVAGHSPDRLIEDLLTGQSVLIVTSIIMMSSFSYIRVVVASKLRKDGGRRSLLLCGGVTQLGSFCGAIVAFILVQVLHLFRSMDPCEF